jgi:rhamnose utilization protein RhaD (predicted bifunctional aldolase and dehydrogenase)
MGNAKKEDWVWLNLSECVEVLEDARKKGITKKADAALDHILQNSKTPKGEKRKASIETLVHVVAFELMGVTWSLHTHPTPVVSLAASKDGAKHYSGTVFPDESVTCGPVPLFLPYAEPGLNLGLGVYNGVKKYLDKYGRAPGQIILGNHGLCTFGGAAAETLATTSIAVKAARVRIGALSAGGINFIPKTAAEKIAFRPDEVARRKLFAQEKK